VFNPAAFKHGVSEADIRMAFDTARYEALFNKPPPRKAPVGLDRSANLIEILYNVIADDRIRVFHAMKCRSAFIRLLGNEEEL
jgi:uncharacterized DUF497 family protein